MPPSPNMKRREQLLTEVEAIVTAEGFAHLRVGALADRLHCSRSTLYKLAPTKEDLIVLVFERLAERIFVDSARAASEAKTAAEKCIRYSSVTDERVGKISDQFWRDVRDNPRVAEVLSESRARGFQNVVGYIEEGVASGEFREVNTKFVGHLIWSTSRELRNPDLRDALGIAKEHSHHELINLLVRGLRAGN